MPVQSFQDFHTKVHQLLEFDDPEIVLPGLASLAEGSEATVPGGTIEPLSGLKKGNLTPLPSDNELYRAAMRGLLEWGLRLFPTEPNSSAVRLWCIMARFDGDSGYNQRLVRNPGIPSPTHLMTEEGFTVVPSIIFPTIVRERNYAPVQTFNGDSITIANFMKEDVDTQAVLATTSLYGWESLATECHILYIDGKQSSKESLAMLFAKSEIPSIIIGCELRDITSVMEARELLFPPGWKMVDISRREYRLKNNSPLRVPTSVSPFRHGQSISQKGDESKGSVGVFLTPTGEEESYALTASHVFPGLGLGSEVDVVTPGYFDILSLLHSTLKSRESATGDIDFLLKRSREPCGTVFKNHIGSRENGWRSDWALIQLDSKWRGVNGSWYDESDMRIAFYMDKTTESDNSFSGKAGLLNRRDPLCGELCCKDGAATGVTFGTVGRTSGELFRKGSSAVPNERESPDNTDKCKVLLMNPIMTPDLDANDPPKICRAGDSGAAVFCADEKNDGWTWVGQLVGRMNPSHGPTCGLVIPQSEVLSSVEDVTGTTWDLTGLGGGCK